MRKLLAGPVLVLLVLLATSSVAGAGGWAVTSLDPMGAPVAGVPIDVGFTIRQHGVTPVDLDDVFVVVTGADGTRTEHAAHGDGVEGHYVASVTFGAGTSTWEVEQGWFGPQTLGSITVPSAGAAAVGAAPVVESSSYRWPGAARALVPLAAIALATVAIGDAIVSRRRKSAPTP